MRLRLAMGLLLACIAPLAAEAQPAGKMPRVGVLANGSAATSPPVDAFRRGLRDFGYVEGQNIALEIKWAEGRFERLPELATELVRWKPDVLVTAGPYGLQAARRATTTIPIVMIRLRSGGNHGGTYCAPQRPHHRRHLHVLGSHAQTLATPEGDCAVDPARGRALQPLRPKQS